MKKIIVGLFTLGVFLAVSATTGEEVQLEEITDFQAMSKKMKQENLVLVLEFHAENCSYCRQLEEEILIPMLHGGDYNDQMKIRQLALDSNEEIKGFSGEITSGARFGEKMGVIVTPTLVFLNADGKEISERIVGINTPELFGAYVDAAIEEGHQALLNGKKLEIEDSAAVISD